MPDIGRRKLRQLYLDSTDRAKENAKRALILLGESHLLSVIENIEGDFVMGGKVKVTLGDGNTFYGDFVVAQSIENSFNKAASANTSGELKDLLKALSVAVGKMSEQLSKDEAKRVARALDTLVDEATSEKPDRQWWQVSVDGLAKAAENIGKVGKPVLDIINRLVPILVSVSG